MPNYKLYLTVRNLQLKNNLHLLGYQQDYTFKVLNNTKYWIPFFFPKMETCILEMIS